MAMIAILGLLLFFLAVGVLARSYNLQVRVLMSVGIIVLILYLYIA
jgi:hypothetical protein